MAHGRLSEVLDTGRRPYSSRTYGNCTLDTGRPSYMASAYSTSPRLRSALQNPRSIQPAVSTRSDSPLETTVRVERHSDDLQPPIPFADLQNICDVLCDGRIVEVSIDAEIDNKNFFRVDDVWTCYRRNYLAVTCSYSLDPSCEGKHIFLQDPRLKKPRAISAFAMTIAATLDRAQGKKVELIRHTAKRDKAPQLEIKLVKLPPNPPQSAARAGAFHSTAQAHSPILPLQRLPNDPSFYDILSAPQQECKHSFDRIQYKVATQNNGRRRSAQQFYHLVVQLWADVRQTSDQKEEWVKVAYCTSPPMVVRGRSPSHYKDKHYDRGAGPAGAGGTGRPCKVSGIAPHGSWPSSREPERGPASGFIPIADNLSGQYGPYRSHNFPDSCRMSNTAHVPSFKPSLDETRNAGIGLLKQESHCEQVVNMFPNPGGYQYVPGLANYDSYGTGSHRAACQGSECWHSSQGLAPVVSCYESSTNIKEEPENEASHHTAATNDCRSFFQAYSSSSGHYPAYSSNDVTGF